MLLSDTLLPALVGTARWLTAPSDPHQAQAVLATSPSIPTYIFPAALNSLTYTPSTYLSSSTASSPRHFSSVCVLRSTCGGDDTDNFEAAVSKCGRGGLIHLPDDEYSIHRPMTTHLVDAVLDAHGFLTFSPDIDYWIENAIRLPFQNQSLAWVITGSGYVLDGNDLGGIDGNGQAWYSRAKDESNMWGRPMTMTIKDSRDVQVRRWTIKQPQFWASLVWNSRDVLFRDCLVNATSYDSAANGSEKHWLQNTDGSDTYRSHNVTYENWTYQGGDDCLAFKPNSTLITVRNATCYGGSGIAFGSVGQYPGINDTLEDILLEDIKLYPSPQVPLYQGIYFKSWLGVWRGHPPNGGGGGTGWTRNITVRDVVMEECWHPITVVSDISYVDDIRSQFPDTSTYDFSDITMHNITGTALKNRIVYLACSKMAPCRNWHLSEIDIRPLKHDHPEISYVCNNVDSIDGLHESQRCHASNSTLEREAGGTIGDKKPKKPGKGGSW